MIQLFIYCNNHNFCFEKLFQVFPLPYNNVNCRFCRISVATVAMFTSGKYKAAVNIWYNLCLVRYRELLGTHPFTASLLHYIGDAYQKLGDARHAVAFKKESLAMRKSLLGNMFSTQHCYFFYTLTSLSSLSFFLPRNSICS